MKVIDWSFMRSVLEQGGDIHKDYMAGNHKDYEAYARRLDEAARERIDSISEPPKPDQWAGYNERCEHGIRWENRCFKCDSQRTA